MLTLLSADDDAWLAGRDEAVLVEADGGHLQGLVALQLDRELHGPEPLVDEARIRVGAGVADHEAAGVVGEVQVLEADALPGGPGEVVALAIGRHHVGVVVALRTPLGDGSEVAEVEAEGVVALRYRVVDLVGGFVPGVRAYLLLMSGLRSHVLGPIVYLQAIAPTAMRAMSILFKNNYYTWPNCLRQPCFEYEITSGTERLIEATAHWACVKVLNN